MDTMNMRGVHASHHDAEFHHHHSHGPASHHPGHHHLLAVEGLNVSFEMYDPAASFWTAPRVSSKAVRELTLSVHEGEVLAVVGASGSGKTVLADALLGLYEPNAKVTGRIWFDGEECDAGTLASLRGHGISLVPQSISNLDPLMRVGEQVQGMPQGRTRTERATDRARRVARQQELFAAYGLAPEVADLYPHQLSGGMARRVLIMCALMDNPRLIIADEPTPGLDLDLAVHALDDLRAFADRGGGVLLVTHDLELALRVADRVAVFRDGTVVEETAVESFDDPALLRHPFSRSLWHAMPEHGFASESGGIAPGERDAFHDGGARQDVAALEAWHLMFSYPGVPPLYEGLSLSVRPGERVALCAPSGAGKTTLCRLLAGYLQPSGGEVVVDGESLARFARAHAPLPVQLIWQHPEQAFDPRMRMARSLAEAGDPDGERGRMLRDRFGIRDEWLARLPHELSGGELMRFCLVRALLARPRYLICDESTAMLDAVTQAELWGVLLDILQDEQMGLIFVSHSPDLVERIATRRIEL